MDEYVDLLDQYGNKTGKTKWRSKVHKDGDWHKSVLIWIINDNNEILLQRRSNKKSSHPNMLDTSVSGHVMAKENSIDAAIREIKEELNIDVEKDNLELLDTIKRSSVATKNYNNNEFNDIYFYKTNKTLDEMDYNKHEISELIYIPYKDLRNMYINKREDLLIEGHEEVFNILFDKLKGEGL